MAPYAWDGAHLFVDDYIKQTNPFTTTWDNTPDDFSPIIFDPSKGTLYHYGMDNSGNYFYEKGVYIPTDDIESPNPIMWASPDMLGGDNNYQDLKCELPGMQDMEVGSKTILTCNAGGATRFVAPATNFKDILSLASFVRSDQISPDIEAQVMGCTSVPTGFPSS